LLTIILKAHFDFPVEKHAQAIGFLMNRRGFSFLEEEYSKDGVSTCICSNKFLSLIEIEPMLFSVTNLSTIHFDAFDNLFLLLLIS
jgi:hypothetical protein